MYEIKSWSIVINFDKVESFIRKLALSIIVGLLACKVSTVLDELLFVDRVLCCLHAMMKSIKTASERWLRTLIGEKIKSLVLFKGSKIQ